MKGRTKWIPRHIEPVRNGRYECAVQISRAVPLLIWTLEWDGVGFLSEGVPMVVKYWRGLTRKAYLTALGEEE